MMQCRKLKTPLHSHFTAYIPHHAMNSILLFIVALLTASATAHVIMANPRQRGALSVAKGNLIATIDASAPRDPRAHFPAGSKSTEPGAARKSLERAGGHKWTEFEPLRPGFKWRSGVCGDELGHAQDHMMGGKYFGDGATVRHYRKEGTIGITMDIIMHHLGFFEFHLCDVARCGGEISAQCFADGHCHRLDRAPTYCDSGKHMSCGPIDRKYPGRFYLPCHGDGTAKGNNESFLSTTMHYKLPKHLECEHCVVQMHYTTGFTCNAKGVVDYFTGIDRPSWGTCKGNAGAVGGISWAQRPCAGPLFAEEYMQCADVAIGDVKPRVTPTPARAPRVTPTPVRSVQARTPSTRTTSFAETKVAPTPTTGAWVTPTPTRGTQVTVAPRPLSVKYAERTDSASARHLAAAASRLSMGIRGLKFGDWQKANLLVDILRKSAGQAERDIARRQPPSVLPSAFRRRILLLEVANA